MQKIKLAEYGRKNDKLNDSVLGTNFDEAEQSPTVEKKMLK